MSFHGLGPRHALLVGADDSVQEVELSGWLDYHARLGGQPRRIEVSPSVTLWVNKGAGRLWAREGAQLLSQALALNRIGYVLCADMGMRGPVLVTGPPDGQGDVTPAGREAVRLAAQLVLVLLEENKHESNA